MMAQADLSRVLVVDDAETMLAATAALLEDSFSVVTAKSLAEAQAELSRGPFDVVLSDYEMPGGSGLILLRHVHDRFPGTVCILITGHAEHPEVRAARVHWRQFSVLIKPYDPSSLIACVEGAARLARLRRATLKLKTQIKKT